VRWDFRYYELLFSPTRRSVSYSTPKSSRSDTPMRDHCGTVARRISFTNLVQVTENKLRSAIGSKLIGLRKAEPYSMTSCHMVERRVLNFGYSLTQICNSLYWQASHSSPFIMASIEQAFFSSALNSFFTWSAPSTWPASPLTSFFTLVVAFSIFEAPRVRK